MLTTVIAQHAEWWSRSDREVARRIALIEKDGNILHAFAPKSPPRKPFSLFLAHIRAAAYQGVDRRKKQSAMTGMCRRKIELFEQEESANDFQQTSKGIA